MRRASSIAIVLAFALSPSNAVAQQAQPTLTQSATDSFDRVYLTSGGLARGHVTEIVPEDHVTLIIAGSGETKQFAWSEIVRIVTATVPAPMPERVTPLALDTPPTTVPRPTQWRANRPLVVTGAILFGVGYGSDVIVAAPSTLMSLGRFASGKTLHFGAMRLLIPFIGPILFVHDHPYDAVIASNSVSDFEKALLYTSAVFQFAGVASVVAGIVFGGRPVSQQEAMRTTFRSLSIEPLAAPNAVGVSVGIRRW